MNCKHVRESANRDYNDQLCSVEEHNGSKVLNNITYDDVK